MSFLLLLAAADARPLDLLLSTSAASDVYDLGDQLDATARVTDHTGAPLDVDTPSATAELPDGSHRPLNIYASSTVGVYTIDPLVLDIAGPWRIRVTVVSPGAAAETLLIYVKPDPTGSLPTP